MEIIGKIIVALPEATGTSKAGNAWKKREYVLETQETYPKKIFFDFFGDRADQYPLQVGQTVKLVFDIDSREYQGRWYTSVRGIRTENIDAQAPYGAPMQQPQYQQPQPFAQQPQYQQPQQPQYQQPGSVPPPPPIAQGDSTDDLPF